MTDLPSAVRDLRSWLLANGRNLREDTLTDSTALFEQRHITSIQVPDLLLLIESLRGKAIDLAALRPGDLKDLRTITARFLSESHV